MLSGCWNMLSCYLVVAGLLLTGVAAKDGPKTATKLGNSTIERTVQLRTHSLYPPYIDQDLQNRWWDFGADAYVNTNKHIRLTQHKQSQMGWLWSRLALTAANWVIEVEFKIGGETSHLFGDGMAMWITTDRATSGPVFGSKDYFNGLGIMLDTYANAKHNYGFPRISAVKLDGQTKYDYGNDGDSQALGGCSHNFRKSAVATKLKVTYIKDNLLDVKLQYKGWDEWTNCFSIPNISLPPNPFVGFSAMTGDVADAHDIVSVTTYSAILSPVDKPRDTLDPKKKWMYNASRGGSAQKGTWSGFFFKVVLFFGVAAGLGYAYKEYQRRQRFGGLSGGMGSAYPSSGGASSFLNVLPRGGYTPSTAGFSAGGGLHSGYPGSAAGGGYTPSTAGGYGGNTPTTPGFADRNGPSSGLYSAPPQSAAYGRKSPFGGPPPSAGLYSSKRD